MVEQQIWDGDLASDSFLAGRLPALQTILMLFLDVQVFHSGNPPSRDEFMQAWGLISEIVPDKDLTGDARDGFNETMRWFNKGLAGASPWDSAR